MKKILTLILIFSSLLLEAQNNSLLLYVDASKSDKNLKAIGKTITSIVDSLNSPNIYLYISNGDKPMQTNDRSDISNLLRDLRIAGYIKSPDFFYDIKQLNTALIGNNFISNLNDITKESGVQAPLDIYFWFNEDDFNQSDIIKNFITPFLLSNKLLYKSGLQNNCSIYFYDGVKMFQTGIN